MKLNLRRPNLEYSKFLPNLWAKNKNVSGCLFNNAFWVCWALKGVYNRQMINRLCFQTEWLHAFQGRLGDKSIEIRTNVNLSVLNIRFPSHHEKKQFKKYMYGIKNNFPSKFFCDMPFDEKSFFFYLSMGDLNLCQLMK